MAIGTWSADITAGVIKNHELSRDILQASYETTRALDTVRVYPFGKNRGQSLTVPRFHALTEPSDASLVELPSVPEDAYQISEATITAGEYARKLPYTSLQEDLLAFDLDNELQDALREQMTLILDTLAITAHKKAKVYAYPAGASTLTFTTNGAAGGAATVDLNGYHVEEIVKYLAETLFAPAWEDGDYVGLCRYRSLLSLRRDTTNWTPWHVYTDPEAKWAGEAGRYERCRFIETTHSAALKNLPVATSLMGEAIFTGKTPVGMIEVTPFELRADIPTDMGRKKAVGWYGIVGFNELWGTATAREARSVVFSSTA